MSGVSARQTQAQNRNLERLLTMQVSRPDYDAFSQSISAHLALPGLRAFWPMSSVAYTNPQALDISGNGNHLTNNAGVVEFGYDGLAPIAKFNGGANQYLSRAAALANWASITGGEAFIRGPQQGLTIPGWFWWTALPGAAQYLAAKDDGGANRSYRVVITVANAIAFRVWPGPVTVTSGATINAGWNHIVCRYDATSQTLLVVLNGAQTTQAGAPVALTDSAAPFTIGADGAGTTRFTGYSSMDVLCAASVSVTQILALREQSRAMFGV